MKKQEQQIERRTMTAENIKEMRKTFLKGYYARLDAILKKIEDNNPLNQTK
ncbi:MAG: hypothetical protein ACOYLO_15485 [Ferruginibacter sp.]